MYYPPLPAPPYENETFDEGAFEEQLTQQITEQQLDHFRMLPINYRLREKNLVPYRDMSFAFPNQSFIRSVTIGPKCPLDRETVKLFLERYRIPINMRDIYLSDVSYR